MEHLLFDAMDTIALDEVLASNEDVDALNLDDFNLFAPSQANAQAAKVLSAPESPVAVDLTSGSDGAQSSSDHETAEDKARPKTVNHSRKRQREEIEYLRSKVVELEQHLANLQQVKDTDVLYETPWQKMANEMRIAKQNAMHENNRLKRELEEYIEFGKALELLMKKKPKLTTLPSVESEQWRVFKLVKDPVLRLDAVNEILLLLHQMTDGAMVEAGLADRVDEYEAYTPRLAKTSADLVISVSFCTTKQFDFNVVSDLAWLVFQEGICAALKHQTLERFDDYTSYVRYERFWSGLGDQANCLYKRFREPHRDVIVCRTVLEDELNPFRPDALIMNKSAWIVLEKVDDGKACRIKLFQKCTLPMVQSSYGTRVQVNQDALQHLDRVGSVTDSVMFALQTTVLDFSNAINNLMAAYNGNVKDTFKLVRRA
ncbi:hypothetical protein AC1031_008532 [Aphanomyces cochlioides]|nr:hypothetical protein AC1031_008532 [Aphanomyces cochlioides]